MAISTHSFDSIELPTTMDSTTDRGGALKLVKEWKPQFKVKSIAAVSACFGMREGAILQSNQKILLYQAVSPGLG